MKKYIQNTWVRILSCFLCAISVLMLGIAVVSSVFYAEMGSGKDTYEQGAQEIADSYALYAYDLFVAHKNEKKLSEFLEENSLYCSVYKIEEETGNPSLLYSNRKEDENFSGSVGNETEEMVWDFTTEVVEGSSYNYNINSIWGALFQCRYYGPADNWTELVVTGFVYDAATGLFYYETEAGYFVIEDIWIYLEDSSHIDYRLETINDQLCYYNGYYDIVLDPSQEAEWKYMATESHRLRLWEYERTDEWEVVEYIQNPSIVPANWHDIEYQVIGADETIGFSYDQKLDKYQIQISWRNTGNENLFLNWQNTVEMLYNFEDSTTLIMVAFFILFIISGTALVLSTTDDAGQLGIFHKVPVCMYFGVFLLIEVFCWVLIQDGILELILYEYIQMEVGYALLVITVFLMVLLAFICLQNLITRIRTRSFLRYSEIYYAARIIKWIWCKVADFITRPFRFMSGLVKENVSLVWKGITVLVIIAFIEFVVVMVNIYDSEAMSFWFIWGKLIEIPLCINVLLQMKTLQDGAKSIASGDLSNPIDTSKMLWEFKKHGDYINNVSESIHLAVNEQMKSERFKTELITNVSHDIKTPLTSIINYVDLIKKEKITDEKLCEYVDVLDRQSARLKKLIEDLMEASKASTGNLTVNLEECDVEVLLTQIIGEFEEKLQANALQVVTEKPEHPVLVMADGRHMWRVLDNLLGNACKYAMPNTRLYVSLKQEGELATIVFKNISRVALNTPSEELMERFVRGDSSRNTEGSGLGLSIAQSLTELMNGTMKLEIDGDLFKVTLQFHALNKQ